MKITIFLERFIRRLRHLFRIYEMWENPFESCRRCGNTYQISIGIYNEKWKLVNGKEAGCLCPSCFVVMARDKGIRLKISDIERLFLCDHEFNCFYIISPEESNKLN